MYWTLIKLHAKMKMSVLWMWIAQRNLVAVCAGIRRVSDLAPIAIRQLLSQWRPLHVYVELDVVVDIQMLIGNVHTGDNEVPSSEYQRRCIC